MTGVDDLLAKARARLRRITASDAATEQAGGALLVDIRPSDERAGNGDIPGAVVIDRNVLEWRLDPTSPWRSPLIRDHHQRVILICGQGYQSSLAAANLQEMGLVNATDVIDGFVGWLAADLPVRKG
jgi:rhodanese-related sulfurtransferase